MKNLPLILSLLLLSGYSIDNRLKPSVVFIITTTTPYCGGANKTEENKNLVKKEIAKGKTFYIIKGKQNTRNRKIITSFTMGKDNSGCIYLPAGTYSVINRFSFQKLLIDQNKYDIGCMQQLWATPLFSFTINKAKCETIVHNISLQCDYDKPCTKLNIDIPM